MMGHTEKIDQKNHAPSSPPTRVHDLVHLCINLVHSFVILLVRRGGEETILVTRILEPVGVDSGSRPLLACASAITSAEGRDRYLICTYTTPPGRPSAPSFTTASTRCASSEKDHPVE
jgi:hypothetical protein